MKKIVSLVLSIIILASCIPGYAATSKKFTDVQDNVWYAPYVYKLVQNKNQVIVGYKNGKFGPEDKLLVAQVITMICRAKGYTNLKYYQGYVDKAVSLGWVKKGEYDSYTRPAKRGEIARLIVRAIGSKETYPASLPKYKTLIKDFSDSYAASEYVLKCYFLGIVSGYSDGRFAPEDTTNRAQASKMVLAMLDPWYRGTVTLKVDQNTSIINGYTIRLDEKGKTLTITDKEFLPEGSELRYFVNLLYSDEKQQKCWGEITEVLTSKFGKSIAQEVVSYAKKKTTEMYELPSKVFNTSMNRKIIVYGNSPSSQIVIDVEYTY